MNGIMTYEIFIYDGLKKFCRGILKRFFKIKLLKNYLPWK